MYGQYGHVRPVRPTEQPVRPWPQCTTTKILYGQCIVRSWPYITLSPGPSLGILQDGWHNYIFLSRSDPYKYILKVELKLVISGRVDATRCSKLTGGMPPVPPVLMSALNCTHYEVEIRFQCGTL